MKKKKSNRPKASKTVVLLKDLPPRKNPKGGDQSQPSTSNMQKKFSDTSGGIIANIK